VPCRGAGFGRTSGIEPTRLSSTISPPDRGAEGPQRIIADFRTSFLQADACSAYDRIHSLQTSKIAAKE
jgi:hypothetical protein